MKIRFILINLLFLYSCSTHKNMIVSELGESEQPYQLKLGRYVLAKPPEDFSKGSEQEEEDFAKYGSWVAKYPKMANISILSGFFEQGNCEIAIQDANGDGRYDGINQDFIHLLHSGDQFSEWSDLYSNSILLKEVNYFKVNNILYSIKAVENNGPMVIINAVDSVVNERCMYFPDEIPATDIEFEKIEFNKYVTVKDIVSKSDKKSTVLSFWATWCAPCIDEIPVLNKISKYANLVTLCTDKRYDGNLNDFIENKNMTGIHCYSSKNTSRLFCQNGVPFLVLLDENGKIVLKSTNASKILDYFRTNSKQ